MYNPEFKNTEEETDPDDYLDTEAMMESISELMEQCPFVASLEDPLDPEDMDNWKGLREKFPDKHFVVDEINVTNEDALEDFLGEAETYCLCIRLGRIGTISEAIDYVKKAREAGWQISVSAG